MGVEREADRQPVGASPDPTELPFKWPVLGFGREVGIWSDFLVCFRNADQFRTCGPSSLRGGHRIGMVLFDATGRSWTIATVRMLGKRRPSGWRILVSLLFEPTFDIEVGFTESPPATFDELKSRTIETIDAYPYMWRDDEALAGESGPPRDEQEMLDELKDRVRQARTMDELIKGAEIIDAE